LKSGEIKRKGAEERTTKKKKQNSNCKKRTWKGESSRFSRGGVFTKTRLFVWSRKQKLVNFS
jgi:hypothetical protein